MHSSVYRGFQRPLYAVLVLAALAVSLRGGGGSGPQPEEDLVWHDVKDVAHPGPLAPAPAIPPPPPSAPIAIPGHASDAGDRGQTPWSGQYTEPPSDPPAPDEQEETRSSSPPPPPPEQKLAPKKPAKPKNEIETDSKTDAPDAESNSPFDALPKHSGPDHVLLVTTHFSRPDFIRMQHYYYSHFLKEKFTMVVVNDALEEPSFRNGFRDDVRANIEAEARNLGIEHVSVPPKLHDYKSGYLAPYIKFQDKYSPGQRCAVASQYSYAELISKWPGLVMLSDSDMWPVAPLSVRDALNGSHIAGVKQYRGNANVSVQYMWNGLVLFDMASFPEKAKKDFNFHLGKVLGFATDVGGQNHFFFIKHRKDVKVNWFRCQAACASKDHRCDSYRPVMESTVKDAVDRDRAVQMTSEYCQKQDHCSEFCQIASIYHYRSGGGWRPGQIGLHEKRVNLFDWTWLRSILNESDFKQEYKRYRKTSGVAKRILMDIDGQGAGRYAAKFLERVAELAPPPPPLQPSAKENGLTRATAAPSPTPNPKMAASATKARECFSSHLTPELETNGSLPWEIWLLGRPEPHTITLLHTSHPENNVLSWPKDYGNVEEAGLEITDDLDAAKAVLTEYYVPNLDRILVRIEISKEKDMALVDKLRSNEDGTTARALFENAGVSGVCLVLRGEMLAQKGKLTSMAQELRKQFPQTTFEVFGIGGAGAGGAEKGQDRHGGGKMAPMAVETGVDAISNVVQGQGNM